MLSKNYSSSIHKTTNAPLDQNSSVEEFEKRCAFTCLAQKRVLYTLCVSLALAHFASVSYCIVGYSKELEAL